MSTLEKHTKEGDKTVDKWPPHTHTHKSMPQTYYLI